MATAGRAPDARLLTVLGLIAASAAAASAVALGTTALLLAALAGGAVLLLRHPAVLLAIFLFVPFFKSLPVLAQAPADPTLATGGLLAVAMLVRVRRDGVAMPPVGFVVPFLAIVAVFASSLLFGEPVDYGYEKVQKLVTVTLLAAAAPFVLLRERRDLVRFVLAVAVGAIVVAVLTPFVRPTVAAGIVTEFDTQGRYSFGGQIYPARFLSMGAIILATLPLWTRHRWRAIGPVVAIGVTVIALGFGARGPIAALALTMLTVTMLLVLTSPRALAAVLVVGVVAGVLLSVVPLQGTATERFDELARNPVETLREDPRFTLYDAAVELLEDGSPFGRGSGAYAPYGRALSPPKQELLYPHNVFLELGVEGGVPLAMLVGFSFVGALGLLLRRFTMVRAGPDRGVVTLVLGLLLFNLLAAQFSGDINDNRVLWSLLALAWTIGRDGPPRSKDAAPA